MTDVRHDESNPEVSGAVPKSVNVAYLRFLRWLAERGRLEHLPAGPSTGAWAQSE